MTKKGKNKIDFNDLINCIKYMINLPQNRLKELREQQQEKRLTKQNKYNQVIVVTMSVLYILTTGLLHNLSLILVLLSLSDIMLYEIRKILKQQEK